MNPRTFSLIGLLLLLTSCSTLRRLPVSPSTSIILPNGGQLNTGGDAATSPKLGLRTVRITGPAGLLLSNPKGQVRAEPSRGGPAAPSEAGDLKGIQERTDLQVQYAESAATQLASIEVTTADTQGPVAYQPASGPTPSQEADGIAKKWYYLGLVLGMAAGAFGLVERWPSVAAGGGCVAVACVLGIWITDNPIVLWIIGAGVTVAVVGPYLWHTIVKRLPPTT